MRLLKTLTGAAKWFGLGILWAMILVLHPNVQLDNCTVTEALQALLPWTDDLGKTCMFSAGVATPFLNFSENGDVSWGWTWFELVWHLALWALSMAATCFSLEVWRKRRARQKSV